jgi:hypothetical protein
VERTLQRGVKRHRSDLVDDLLRSVVSLLRLGRAPLQDFTSGSRKCVLPGQLSECLPQGEDVVCAGRGAKGGCGVVAGAEGQRAKVRAG